MVRNGAPVKSLKSVSLKSVSLENPHRNSQDQYLHKLSFKGLFSYRDEHIYADGDNDTNETDGPVRVPCAYVAEGRDEWRESAGRGRPAADVGWRDHRYWSTW
jgi:hypothetical protein